jgi:hypothetical protein
MAYAVSAIGAVGNKKRKPCGQSGANGEPYFLNEHGTIYWRRQDISGNEMQQLTRGADGLAIYVRNLGVCLAAYFSVERK